jgi:FAD/FMN-containing dehydrogenase
MAMTQHIDAEQAVISDLKGKIRGPLLRPGDAGFDDARSVWNAMIDRRPAMIVRCLGVTDVVACVNASRERGLPLSIKGGGHNIAGLAVSDGSLLLDMSLMRGVWVDPSARIARAQPGCLLADVDAETQLHGLATVLGFVSATGCAGLTLGGGFGYLTRRFGWTSDNLTSIDLVTAAGGVVECVVAAETSASPRASSTSSIRSVPISSVARSRGAPRTPPAFSRCIDRL